MVSDQVLRSIPLDNVRQFTRCATQVASGEQSEVGFPHPNQGWDDGGCFDNLCHAIFPFYLDLRRFVRLLVGLYGYKLV
jgi:hypothetical protein